MAQLPWAANTEENSAGLDDYTPLPTGEYPGMIVKSEMKPTKNRDGYYLQLNIKIIDGDYKGRMVFDRLNLDNPNPVAVEIANKALNTICQACHKIGVQDSEELHGIPFMVKVRLVPETDTQPANNNVTYYGPYDPAAVASAPTVGEDATAFHQAAVNQQAAKVAAKPAAKPFTPPAAKPAVKPAAKPAAKKLPWEK